MVVNNSSDDGNNNRRRGVGNNHQQRPLFPQLFSQIIATSIMTLLVSLAYLQDVKEMVFGSGSDGGDGDRAQTTSAALEEEAELETSINAATFTTNDDPVSRHPHLLIQHHGFICKEYDVVTKDGFILTLQRIVVQGEESDEASNNTTSSTSGKASTSKEPVLLVHGLFQSSGVFLSNGKKSSLAFHLANLGYDVWLGNNRCVEKKHTTLTDSDPAFWDWSLDELARYDFPTMIDLVCRETSRESIFYIGHSQGNAQAFLGLSLDPTIARKIKLFTAIAPAVYIGPLLRKPPVSFLTNFSEATYKNLFGEKEFLPIMNPVQEYFPPVVFASLAYHMFHYLFGWHDTNWDKSNKPKYFQCTPRPTSTKIIYHWCCIGRDQVIGEYEKVSMNDDYNNNGFSSSNSVSGKTVEIEEMANSLLKNRKNTISNSEDNYDDSDTTPVNDSEVGLDYTPTSSSRPTTFDVKCLQCPMALIYGDKDEIIDADRLAHECSLSKDVQLVLAEKIAGYEHLDPLWAVDAKARVFDKIVYAMKSSNQRCNNIHQ